VIDLAVLGQDPRFGGGAWALMKAFWGATISLGRQPRLYYLAHPSLAGACTRAPLDEEGLRPPFRRLDAANHLWATRKLAPSLHEARSLWVVATTAHYGAAAIRSGRPYSCWLATTLEDEWRPQMRALPRSRQAARRLNGPILRSLERRVLRGATSLYAISPGAREAIAHAARVPVERVGVIPLPIDTDEFIPVSSEEFERGLEHPQIIFVGRADDPRKNVQLLLQAWPAIRRRHPDARLRLVGRPPSVALPDGANAVGEVDSIAAELRGASLVVLPSVQEGFGIVLAEALAAGVPAVTTPSGGPEELVRQSGGGVVLGGFSTGELAAAVSDALADGTRLARMRTKGRAYVEREHSFERTRADLADALAG
jgi:glycosyltransferase involved in cell wall biosynthesis